MTSPSIGDGAPPETPYPGIDPYSFADREVFFARELEVRTLSRQVVINRAVLLYSASGVGKSSLINAGLCPEIVREGYHPVRIRVQPLRGQEIIGEALAGQVAGKKALPDLVGEEGPADRLVLGVEEFTARVAAWASSQRLLLIFDQFEELTTLFDAGSEVSGDSGAGALQTSILSSIASLIRDRALPVKTLIALREDYLAQLTPLFERCPQLTDQYLRLTPLDGDQILRMIRGPFDRHPGLYSPEIRPELARAVRDQLAGRSTGGAISLTEVQIVCRSLFEAGRAGQDLDQFFAQRKGVQGILEGYLEDVLNALSPTNKSHAEALLSRMLTPAGTRNVISADDLVSRVALEEDLPREELFAALNELERKAKLVRRERRRKVDFFEIASEFLVDWIRRRARRRQDLADLKRLEKDAEEWKSKARRAYMFAGLLLMVVTLGLLALFLGMSARQERRARVVGEVTAEASALASSAHAELTRKPYGSLAKAVQAAVGPLAEGIPIPPTVETSLREVLSVVGGTLLGGAVGGLTVEAVSADGHWVTGRAADGGYYLCDLTLGESAGAVQLLPAVTEQDPYFSFGPSGKWLAAALPSGPILLWRLDSPERDPRILPGKIRQVPVLEFSRDARWLASGGLQKTVKLWNLEEEASQPRVLEHNHPVKDAAFGLTEDTLVTCDQTGTLWLWHAKEPPAGVELSPIPGGHALLELNSSPDGRWLAARDFRSVWVGSWGDGDDAAIRWRRLKEWSSHPQDMAFDGESRQLAVAAGESSVWVWRPAVAGEDPVLFTGGGGRMIAVAFGPKGRQLAGGSADGTVRIWRTGEPAKAPVLLTGRLGGVGRLAFGPDGRWIVTDQEQQAGRLWDLAQPAADPRRLLCHDVLAKAAFSPGPRHDWLVTGGSDGSVCLWKADQLHETPTLLRAAGGRTLAVGFARQGRTVVAVNQDDGVLTWNLEPLDDAPERVPLRSTTESLQAAVVASNGRVAVVRGSGPLEVIDLDNGEVLSLADVVHPVTALTASPKGRWLATGSSDAKVRLWDFATEDPGATMEAYPGHFTTVQALAFDRDGRWLASGDLNGTALLWDLDAAGGEERMAGELQGGDSVRDFGFSPDGRWLAIGRGDGTMTLVELDEPDRVPFTIDTGSESKGVNFVSFSADGRRLAAGFQGGAISLFNTEPLYLKNAGRGDPRAASMSFVTLPAHRDHVTSLLFHPNNRWLISGGKEGEARLWHLSLNELIDIACRTAGRNLVPTAYGELQQAGCSSLPPARAQ